MALADLLEKLERRTDTPDTSCNSDEVSAKPAPILACALDTPDTQKNSNSERDTPKLGPYSDDRRTCDQCANLEGLRCLAAWRGEIVANRNHTPIRDIPRRCEAYIPDANDPDRRSGGEPLAGTDRGRSVKNGNEEKNRATKGKINHST